MVNHCIKPLTDWRIAVKSGGMCVQEFVTSDQKITLGAQPPLGDFFVLTWSPCGSIFLSSSGEL
jgi:hypothetical protein